MKAIDICCGAGGLSKGFEWAGHNILCGIDVWQDALETFEDNHDSVSIQADIHKTEPSELSIEKEDVGIVIGGPPCKGFSLAGERDEGDDRNKLLKRFLDYSAYFEPEYIVMENVTGILSMSLPETENTVPEYIHNRLKEIGYYSEHKVLDASDFLIPQNRKRVFFIASKNDVPEFPEPFEGNIPVKVALEQDFSRYQNHTFTNHQGSTVEKISELGYEDSLYDSYTESWKRLNPEEPSPTIKENHNAPFIHYEEDRVGTPRECAAIQSFPNSYVFSGSKSSVLKQIGNAVPPVLAYFVAKNIPSNNSLFSY